MKHNLIRYSTFVLLIGFVALVAGRAYARDNQGDNHVEVLSFPFGVSSGQTAHVSLMMSCANGRHLSPETPAIARIQVLDAEGEVITQSDEISVAPGKIRFWDVPRDLLPAGEPTGRLQVRIRVLVTTTSADLDVIASHLALTVELSDGGTGRASVIWVKALTRQEFPGA